ncbi:RidA family protein [Pararhodobacter oceanensis]|uniref:RidA family protein n=1 Tax=Pararhodobacter oceanensis TaxID=2172121 RepID=UPI003A8D495F
MTKITRFSPSGTHAPFSTYSHAVVVEGHQKLIFCAGQVAGDEHGNVLGPEDFEAQGELTIKNLKAVLAEANATLSDVVKLVTYVCNPHDVPKVRALIKKHFSENPPGNTICVISGLAHPDYLLEIDATAVI